MKNQLQKMAPAWHAEAKQLLTENFDKINLLFLDSTKKAVWLGLFLNDIKFRGDKRTGDGSIPHGEFGPWLKANAPGVSWHQANVYMRLARDVCEKGKFQIGDFHQFARNGELPDSVLKIVEGRTQQQLCLEFKQMKEVDGEFVRAIGRRKGEGGRPAAPSDNIEEIIKFNRESALRRMGRVDKELGSLGINFLAQPDDILTAWGGTLERSARCIREWLATPPARRDYKAIQKLYQEL